MTQEAWDYYSRSYNLLSKKMRDAKIEVSLLDNVITAYDEVIRGRVFTNPFSNPKHKNVSKELDHNLTVIKQETKFR